MRETWKAARVGLMVVVGLAAIFAFYRYVEESATGGEGQQVYALFNDAQGLIPKSRVVVAGIPVGSIDKIELMGNQAKVTIQLNDGVEVHDDAAVAMRAVSLLGEKLLVINPGSANRKLLPDGAQIGTVQEGVGTDQVLQTVNEIATNIKDVSKQLQRSFGTDEAGQRMESALANLSEALESVNRTVQQNEDVVNRTLSNVRDVTEQGGPRLLRILENVEATTKDVKAIIKEGRPDLERGVAEVDDTVSSIHRASEQLEDVLSDVRQVTKRTAAGQGTIGRLTSDEVLIDEVEGVAEGLNDLVGGIARLQTIVELRSEYNFLASSFKTYFSLRLQPREDRYFLIQLIDDPRGRVQFSQTLVRRSPALPGEPAEFQETRVTRENKFRFSLMMAKRISFATFRFGILESTGAIGMDFHIWNNRLEINADLFAIGEETLPRVRLRAALEVVSRFWVVAGADDILNSGASDFFMGLQLRFNDEDLKTILPFVGGFGGT